MCSPPSPASDDSTSQEGRTIIHYSFIVYLCSFYKNALRDEVPAVPFSFSVAFNQSVSGCGTITLTPTPPLPPFLNLLSSFSYHLSLLSFSSPLSLSHPCLFFFFLSSARTLNLCEINAELASAKPDSTGKEEYLSNPNPVTFSQSSEEESEELPSY